MTRALVKTVNDPTTMSDEEATRMGHQAYTDADGSTPAGWVLTRARYIPYQMQNGTWRLRFNIDAAVTAGLTTDTISLSGVTFAAYFQALTVRGSAVTWAVGYASSSSSNIVLHFGSGTDEIMLSGDVELASKPTWAA
jgi:hypothetical protein